MEPSRIERVKRGAIMGGTVGLCLGLVLGTWTIFKHGPGSRGYINTLSQFMATSAGSFALFMSIGSFIRRFANLPAEVLERQKWDHKMVGIIKDQDS
ncbi:7269_t:CDS:2 [Ambispora leptoticha]|uniref:7269_t:CDS:1 n=1 Tax=Ambispora leptoticha TaxID=144679 RepID=A0A9N9FSX0_9GLOM|nr:7269_t:CDS:2 [Ambispora leptoticha]